MLFKKKKKKLKKIVLKKNITQDIPRTFYTMEGKEHCSKTNGGSIKRGLKLLEESPIGQSGNKFSIKTSDSNGLIKH